MSFLAVGEHGHLEVGFSIGSLALRVILLAAVLAVAAFALLRGFLGRPGRFTTVAVTVAAVAGAAMELLLSGGLNLPDQVVPLLLLALALPLYLVLSRDERFAAAVGFGRRCAPLVFAVVGVLAAVQFWRALLVDAGAVTALHTGVLLGLVALVWFAVADPRGRKITMGTRVGAAVLGVALLAGAAQAITARPPDPVPGVATKARLSSVTVLVVPNLPGWNLVHVSSDTAAVGTSSRALAPVTPKPGAEGGWRAVELPAGRSDLWVRDAGRLDSFSTDTGTTGAASRTFAGPDGPECVSAMLGRMLAAGTATGARCPSERLDPLDATTLTTMVDALAGHARVALAGDRSPRGLAADRVVRAAAASRGIEVVAPGAAGVPLLLTSGWADAAAVLGRVADGSLPVDRTILAPWLLTGPLLAVDAGQEVGLRFDVAGTSFQRYLFELRGDYPGQAGSAVGYQAWLAGRRQAETGTTRVLRPHMSTVD